MTSYKIIHRTRRLISRKRSIYETICIKSYAHMKIMIPTQITKCVYDKTEVRQKINLRQNNNKLRLATLWVPGTNETKFYTAKGVAL